MTSTTTSIYSAFANHNAATPALTPAALANLEETGTDWREDMAALRCGGTTEEALLEHCLDGADEDRVEGWREYVSALVAAVAA